MEHENPLAQAKETARIITDNIVQARDRCKGDDSLAISIRQLSASMLLLNAQVERLAAGALFAEGIAKQAIVAQQNTKQLRRG